MNFNKILTAEKAKNEIDNNSSNKELVKIKALEKVVDDFVKCADNFVDSLSEENISDLVKSGKMITLGNEIVFSQIGGLNCKELYCYCCEVINGLSGIKNLPDNMRGSSYDGKKFSILKENDDDLFKYKIDLNKSQLIIKKL